MSHTATRLFIGILVLLGWFVIWPALNSIPYSASISQCGEINQSNEVIERWPAGPDGCHTSDTPKWYRPWAKRFRGEVPK